MRCVESMPLFDSITDKVRLGKPLPLHWDLILRAATPVTRVAMKRRLRRPVSSVDAHVISFGNITAGGTGKTPAVIERVRSEVALGRRVAVVTRGYGSARVSEPFVVTPEITPAEVCRLVGDEPALIRHHVPECLIVKAARRVDGARLAVEGHGCDVVVLDDAFQHVQLARDENICLIDASNPFGSGHLIPRGILRESLAALKRATEIVLTRCDQAVDLPGLRMTLTEYVPDLPVRETIHAPGSLWNIQSGNVVSLTDVVQTPIVAVSGIGNPEAFQKTLSALGFNVVRALSYRDHAKIPHEALLQPGVIITTEKDAMRISDPPDNVFALEILLKDWNPR